MKRKKIHIREWVVSKKGIAIMATGGVIVLCIALGGVYFETYALSEKIFPRTIIGSLEVGSFTKEEARQKLKKRVEELKQKGIIITTHKKQVVIPLEEIPLSSDIGIEALSSIFSLDEDKTLESAYAFGRSGSMMKQYYDRTRSSFRKHTLQPIYTYNDTAFERMAEQELKDFFIDSQAAHFEYKNNQKNITITPEVKGKKPNYKSMSDSLKRSLTFLQDPVTQMQFIEVEPFPTQKDIYPYLSQAQAFAERQPLLLTFHDDHITLPPSLVVEWLTVIKNNGDTQFLIDREKLQSYLEEEVVPKINKEALSIRYEIVDGIPTLIQSPQKGRKVLVNQSVDRILKAFETQNQEEVELVIQEIDLNELGQDSVPDVKEIIGKATTSFYSSPKNRKFNISLGARKIHGVVIQPDEEFSLIKFLGEIDEKSGFLPELVIKGNKTKPEFGGGLCQLSTTVFRAVSQSGLPILERRNHSYRVPYYEPPVGYDATIYFPKPDFRFKNDTPNPILIQSSVKGTRITITLWGVKDGRMVEIDAPTVFNRKKPAETKIIETTDLKPGQKKCIERAHEGADAVFERRVVLVTGEKRTDTFKSHYVAWPAVCLVGKKSEEKPKETPEPEQGENPFEEPKGEKSPQEEIKVEKRDDFTE